MPLTAGLIISAGVAGYKAIKGASDASAAAKDMKANVRPSFKIPQQWFDNDNIAASMAEHGLTEPAMAYYTTEAQRGLGSTLGATLQNGGGINSVSNLYDTYNTGINKLAAEDAQLKNQNINNFINVNSSLGNEFEKQWALNYYQPYLDRNKADTTKELAGQQNEFSGLSDLGNSLTAYSNGKSVKSLTSQIKPTSDAASSFAASAGAGAIANPDPIPAAYADPSSWADSPTGAGTMDTIQQMLKANRNSPYLNNMFQNLNFNNAGGIA